MEDFFRWFITDANGNEYMTLLGCSRNDYPVAITLGVVSLIIMIQYAAVAYYNYKKASKYKKSVTKSYILNKVSVFMVCGLTGYGFTILSLFVQPYKLKIIFLLALSIITQRFIIRLKKNNALERIYEGEIALNNKIKEAKEMLVKFRKKTLSSVYWNDLYIREMNMWYHMSSKVRFKKVYQDTTKMIWITEIEPGGEFGEHDHPDCIEVAEVVSGVLLDKNFPDLIVNKGESKIYKIGEPHTPYSDVKTELKITFKR